METLRIQRVGVFVAANLLDFSMVHIDLGSSDETELGYFSDAELTYISNRSDCLTRK